MPPDEYCDCDACMMEAAKDELRKRREKYPASHTGVKGCECIFCKPVRPPTPILGDWAVTPKRMPLDPDRERRLTARKDHDGTA